MAVLEGFGKNRSDFPIADAGADADPEMWPARQGARGRVRGWRGSSTQRGSGETPPSLRREVALLPWGPSDQRDHGGCPASRPSVHHR